MINCKNYEEVSGDGIVRLVRIAKKISKRHGIKIAIAPPQHLAAKAVSGGLVILAQHTDDKKTGSTTGFVVPELLKKSGIGGSIINHSEHRIEYGEIKNLVSRLRRLRMISILCVRNVAEAKKFAKLNPDYIAIEPPELIGSGKAVSRERPELIQRAAAAVSGAKNRSRLLCGAGIVSGSDVKKARELGAKGILVASGIVKAKDWEKAMGEFAESMV